MSSGLGGPHGSLRRGLSLLVKIFFRRVEVVGLENVPADRGGVLVASHPNGLVDPVLILSTFPGRVVFGARHGLFRYPLLGRLMRALGTVPVYRRQDMAGSSVEDQRLLNEQSLSALALEVATGAFAALFPEGISHDLPFLKELKSGAARLYYQARRETPIDGPPPALIPVGLHYDQKRVFRSSALVVIHPPLALPAELDVTPMAHEDPEVVRELARRLTDLVEGRLKDVVMETESWELHQLLHRARKLIRAERASRAGTDPGGASMDEQVMGLRRVWVGYRQAVGTYEDRVGSLTKRVQRYDQDMRGLGIEDHELDQSPPLFRPWLWVVLLSQALCVVLVLPPFLAIGYLVNFPPALLLSLLASTLGKEEKDVASLKLVGGVVLFPLTWAFWGWLATRLDVRDLAPWMPRSPFLAASTTVGLGIAGGVVMLFYVALARATWRAIRVRLTRGRRARSFMRLKLLRSRLCDELLTLSAGLDLPGAVGVDGRIHRVAPPTDAPSSAGPQPGP